MTICIKEKQKPLIEPADNLTIPKTLIQIQFRIKTTILKKEREKRPKGKFTYSVKCSKPRLPRPSKKKKTLNNVKSYERTALVMTRVS